MRIAFLGAGVAAVLLAAGSVSAASVELKHIVAKVVILPENRSDIAVSVIKTNPKLPIRVRQPFGGVTIVDGGSDDWWPRLFGGHMSRCRVGPDATSVHVAGVGDFSEGELPQILVRTPMAARVASNGAVVGSLPAAESLDLSVAGCDVWTIGNIQGRLKLDEAGEGRVRTGDLGSAEVSIAGTSSVTTKAIAHEYKVSIGGAGDLYSSAADGPIEVSIAGSGNVRINGGHTSLLKGSIAGDGCLTYEGTADHVAVSVAGKAKVHVAHVTGVNGPVDDTIMGFGEIRRGP